MRGANENSGGSNGLQVPSTRFILAMCGASQKENIFLCNMSFIHYCKLMTSSLYILKESKRSRVSGYLADGLRAALEYSGCYISRHASQRRRLRLFSNIHKSNH